MSAVISALPTAAKKEQSMTTTQPKVAESMSMSTRTIEVRSETAGPDGSHRHGAQRIRGGGAGKDCFLGLFGCFLCFECCEGCCECVADIICCPCEMIC